MKYDMTAPWNAGVRGEQVLPIINEDAQFIRVEAGPGTGKTFGLKQRILRLLLPAGKGASHKSILVVAFNRVIAADLRDSIGERLRNSDYEGPLPRIQTLHSFCLETLGSETRILLPHEEEAMVYDLLTQCPPLRTRLKSHAEAYKLLKQLQAGLAQDELLADQERKWLIRHGASNISNAPERLLQAIKSGDYDNARFDHVVVDEFQDLTPAEQELVIRLVSPGGSLVALGDPRQSIYGFRGNDRAGLSKIDELSQAQVTDFPMTQCQRCPTRFVDLANAVSVSSDAQPMEYGDKDVDNTHVVYWKTPLSEAKGMAKAILDNVLRHPQDEHLVMTTRKDFGYLLRTELLAIQSDLKVKLVYSEGILESWPAREAFIAFCLLCDPDGATWRSWLAYRNPTRTVTYKATQRNSASYLNLLSDLNDIITFDSIRMVATGVIALRGNGGSNLVERARRIVSIESQFSQFMDDPSSFISHIFDYEQWRDSEGHDPDAARIDLESLCSLALELLEESEGSSIEKLKSVACKLRAHIAMRDTASKPDESPDVTIATLWSAKGVTADHVYVVGLCEDAIPGRKKDSYPGTDRDHYEEQQRLFYVTVTRSKFTLVLSRAKSMKRSDALKLGFPTASSGLFHELKASRFLTQHLHLLPPPVEGESWHGCT